MGWPEMQTAIERLADSMGKDQHEQRRYEIARDVMAGLMADPSFNPTGSTPHFCVEMADALLAELERTDGDGTDASLLSAVRRARETG